MTIGEKIRKARQEKGLTQKELADLMGVTQGAIAQFEQSGDNIRSYTLKKIAKALDITLFDLMYDERDRKKSEAHDGLLKIIENLYNCELEGKSLFGDKLELTRYYKATSDNDVFFLYSTDIYNLGKVVDAAVQAFVECVKMVGEYNEFYITNKLEKEDRQLNNHLAKIGLSREDILREWEKEEIENQGSEENNK